jgi:hypothetical protein
MSVTAPLFEPLLESLASDEARIWTPPKGGADIAPSRFERIEGDGHLTLDAPWVVPALLRSVPIVGRVLEPAASPFPDDGSATRKRASSKRRDALWADPHNQALIQEDDANDDPIPPAR